MIQFIKHIDKLIISFEKQEHDFTCLPTQVFCGILKIRYPNICTKHVILNELDYAFISGLNYFPSVQYPNFHLIYNQKQSSTMLLFDNCLVSNQD
ncbi:hypothetical protein V1477_020081 [Vespula maculifrons]|uniref:Uncharacterized protein n=1 Tax=Vespula maculifrons TaxID=7453 RepID=A0ABD2AKY4_VESMC